MDSLHQILHDIVRLLPHRQEVADELHQRIDQLKGDPKPKAEAKPKTDPEADQKS
jgi:hypothetical protein